MRSVEIYSDQFNVVGPGGQHRSLMIARGLAKYHGYEVYLVTPRFRARYEEVVSRPYDFLKTEPLAFRSNVARRLASYLANGLLLPARALDSLPAIVVLPVPIVRANVAVTKKLEGATVILDFGDVWYSERDPKLYKSLSTRYLVAVAGRFADYVVMPTRMMSELARRLLPEELRGKVVHIPSSIDTTMIRPRAKSDRPRAAYVGSLVGRGVEMLPYLAREASRRCGAEVVVIGSGPLEGWLRRKAEEMGLEGALTIEGPVEFQRLPDACGDCWMGLSLSREETIYPVDILKALVYMALAMPVVSYIDIEEAEGVSVKVPRPDPSSFAEAICALVKDDSLREELSRKARRRAEELYEVKSVSGRYAALLERSRELR